jgi:hypothetical protein
MTDLAPIARALCVAYCRHMGMSEDVLPGYVERGWTEWLPQAADVLDAARPVVAAEVGAELSAMTMRRAQMVLATEARRVLGDPSKCVSLPILPAYRGLDGERLRELRGEQEPFDMSGAPK